MNASADEEPGSGRRVKREIVRLPALPPVPRYFFHVYSDSIAVDEDGQVLPDLHIAKEAAVRAARELAADEIRAKGQLSLRHRIEVEDEDRRPVFTLPFSAAFRVID